MQESRSGLKRQKISREFAGHDSATVNGVRLLCLFAAGGVGSRSAPASIVLTANPPPSLIRLIEA